MSAYGTYLRNGQGSESVLDADVDGTVSSAMGCEVFHILWDRDENKQAMDHWICQHLKAQ